MLSVLIFFLPPLYGEGYNTITALLSNDVVKVTENSAFYQFKEHFWMLFLLLGLLVMLNIFASAATKSVCGMYHRLSDGYVGQLYTILPSSRKKLRVGWYGWSYGRSHARSVDRYFPYR